MDDTAPELLRERADRILSQPQYRANEPGLIDRAWQRFSDFLSDLLSIVTGGTSFGGVLVGWIVLALMVGLVAFLLIRFMPRRRSTTVVSSGSPLTTVHERRSRKEWLDLAAAAESRGAFGEAVHARYRATVAGLVESDAIGEPMGATPSEVSSALTGPATRTDPFQEETDLFSDVWYGGRRADRGTAGAVADLDRRVVEPTR